MSLILYFNFLLDYPTPWQFGLQFPATSIAEKMIEFHDYINLHIIYIGVIVCFLLYYIIITFDRTNLLSKKLVKQFTHNSILEIVWTLIPAFVLIVIAIPSFKLLYILEEIYNPLAVLKVIGHQWYWSYEYNNPYVGKEFDKASVILEDNSSSVEEEKKFNNFTLKTLGKNIILDYSFDSYMIPDNEINSNKAQMRLLSVDNIVKLPLLTEIKVLITSADVLHSWAIPSFGIKVDACPGRLSQIPLTIKREGTFYGQCSEICGVNHGFMPIVVKAIPQGY